jgi:hypothetical protein
VVVIVWYLHLQLPMQSVSITTKAVSSNPVHSEVFLIQHYVIMFVSAKGQLFYLGIPVSSKNKTNAMI